MVNFFALTSEDYVYKVKGGQPVVGEINCLGAKNFLTKAMVAALLGNSLGHKHSAIIVGGTPFVSSDCLYVSDLRAGLACIVAAAIAPGVTTISNINHIERGYGDVVERVSKMNLAIERVKL